jgi:hypothetical protein
VWGTMGRGRAAGGDAMGARLAAPTSYALYVRRRTEREEEEKKEREKKKKRKEKKEKKENISNLKFFGEKIKK